MHDLFDLHFDLAPQHGQFLEADDCRADGDIERVGDWLRNAIRGAGITGCHGSYVTADYPRRIVTAPIDNTGRQRD